MWLMLPMMPRGLRSLHKPLDAHRPWQPHARQTVLFRDHYNAANDCGLAHQPRRRDRMKRTESTMFAGPSALIWPCGRCAALPQIGKVVSIRRLNQ